MKDVTFKDFEKLEYGDQIILEKDPMSQLAGKELREPYVYVTKMSYGPYMFKSESGAASMSIKDDETIEAFGVKLLEESDPEYNKELKNPAQQIGKMLEMMEKKFENGEDPFEDMMNSFLEEG
jgi:hypothetical protein